jgi:tetratricopeptide (TPR) repeat protein
MTKFQAEDSINQKTFHSKAAKEGLEILAEEIEFALKWNRPSILLAVHNSQTGRIDTQRSLEQLLIQKGKQVAHISIDSANPDVIRVMSETPNSKNMVFFVSGIENADRASDGRVYRALNIRRELLVEGSICVVFWLNESEAANLSRLAPDFWSFRHRFVEFAPKHGSKKQSLPVGLFLWEEQIPWIAKEVQKNKLAYYEKFLLQIPKEDRAAAARIETILKLAHFSWMMNDSEKFFGNLKNGIDLLKKYPIPQYQAWMLNAEGIELFEEGKKEDAITRFIQAINIDPNNSAIKMNYSIAAFGLGKNREAILSGDSVVKKDPGNFHLWSVLGYLFLSMEKYEDAINIMVKAHDINPNSLDLHYSLATCYFKNEQIAEYTMELSKAAKISPPQNTFQHAYIDILSGKKGKALEQLQYSIQKEEIQKQDVQRDPNLHFLLNPLELISFH